MAKLGSALDQFLLQFACGKLNVKVAREFLGDLFQPVKDGFQTRDGADLTQLSVKLLKLFQRGRVSSAHNAIVH